MSSEMIPGIRPAHNGDDFVNDAKILKKVVAMDAITQEQLAVNIACLNFQKDTRLNPTQVVQTAVR